MIIDNAGTYTLRYTATDDCGKTTTVDRELVVKEPTKTLFGVYWDGSTNSKLTRINQSAGLADPVPQKSDGNGGWTVGSSPFDEYMPWSGIERLTINDSEFVHVPDFWYKWTPDSVGNGIKLEISSEPIEGFYHSYKFDIGRYMCGNNYKSQTGQIPVSDTGTRMVSGITNNGITNCGSIHYPSLLALWMLYLVEFADFNSQSCIGYGCSESGAVEASGGTDNMTYHTGTNMPNISDYGVTQYRYIEGLWNNLASYCFGVSIVSGNYSLTNASSYIPFAVPSSNGIINKLGVAEYTYNMAFETPKQQFVAPVSTITSTDNHDNYCCDQYLRTGANDKLAFGGRAYRSKLNGIFRIELGSDDAVISTVGCRCCINYMR